jgi:hypothetical protein
MRRGQSIIFFPAGTRVSVGRKQELHLFVHKLYENVSKGGFQTYVVALNSGACWPKDGDLHPGEITLCIESIPAGLNRDEFEKEIQGINTIQSFLPHGARQEALQEVLSGIDTRNTSHA